MFGKPYEALAIEQSVRFTMKSLNPLAGITPLQGLGSTAHHGKVGIMVTTAFATYEILNADNRVKETARQGIIIGGKPGRLTS